MMRARSPSQADPRSILVVLPTWVGDFVMATPTLRAIRSRFDRAHIAFLTEPNLRDLIDGGDWMDECVDWPARDARSPLSKAYRDLVRDLRRRRFDWALLLPNSFRSALIARLAGVRRRIGYDRDGRWLLLTDRIAVPNRRSRVRGNGDRRPVVPSDEPPNLPVKPTRFVPVPMVEYYADLAEVIGCDRPGDRLELATSAACDQSVQEHLTSRGVVDEGPLVVISPGAKYGAAKCWPPERFAEVADRLIETQQATVVVTCGPGEEPIARTIGSAMRRAGIVFDQPRLSLGELKSLIKRSDLLIGNDAGPRHIAKAFNIPVVTIFGPTHPVWTQTSYANERIVRVDVDCGPCQQRRCPLEHRRCITEVSVAMVYEAASELLRLRVAERIA